MVCEQKLGLSKDSVITNRLQGADSVHSGHGEAHHVGVGVVQIKKCTNSSRVLELKFNGNSKKCNTKSSPGCTYMMYFNMSTVHYIDSHMQNIK